MDVCAYIPGIYVFCLLLPLMLVLSISHSLVLSVSHHVSSLFGFASYKQFLCTLGTALYQRVYLKNFFRCSPSYDIHPVIQYAWILQLLANMFHTYLVTFAMPIFICLPGLNNLNSRTCIYISISLVWDRNADMGTLGVQGNVEWKFN